MAVVFYLERTTLEIISHSVIFSLKKGFGLYVCVSRSIVLCKEIIVNDQVGVNRFKTLFSTCKTCEQLSCPTLHAKYSWDLKNAPNNILLPLLNSYLECLKEESQTC